MECNVGPDYDYIDRLRKLVPDYGGDKTVFVYQAAVAHEAPHHIEMGESEDTNIHVSIPAETSVMITKPELHMIDYDQGKITVQVLIKTRGQQGDDTVDDLLHFYLSLTPDGLEANGMRKGPYADGFKNDIPGEDVGNFQTFPEVMDAIAECAADYPGLDFAKIADAVHGVLRDYLNHPTLVRLQTQCLINNAFLKTERLRHEMVEHGVEKARKLREEDALERREVEVFSLENQRPID